MTAPAAALQRYNAFLLLVAGLGGLLYGIDVGIIGSAYPYLEATSHLSPDKLSDIVAAVLLGSVFSTLFAGLLADWMGRKRLMVLSGLVFVASIPIIALSTGFGPLLAGRLLQGISGGLIGIVVPLYLAECLGASNRGKGTGVFQWLLTLGIVTAALIGVYFSYRVEEVSRTASADALYHFKDMAWRSIFWVSLPPGLLFVLGSIFVSESPRWLYRRGQHAEARTALLRSRTPEQTEHELAEMAEVAATRQTGAAAGKSLLQRKYIIPFLLACAILFLNQGTGINSIIGYNTGILLQSGLTDLAAHWGYVLFTTVNFLLTMVGMQFVDRRGRRFLILFGTGGIVLSLAVVGLLFRQSERQTVDAAALVQTMVGADQQLSLRFDPAEAQKLLAATGAGDRIDPQHAAITVIYSYGDFIAATNSIRSDDPSAAPIAIHREDCVPANRIESIFKNPFADLNGARTAPLRIQKAMVAGIPSTQHGWLVAAGLYCFIAFYAFGPGVVVWLALSELMPTRIRSNGMSIALVLNQLLSTVLAGIFLPFVGRWGYSSIFFLFGGFTVVYFVIALFFLPETKGKTLEEIEAHFEGTAR